MRNLLISTLLTTLAGKAFAFGGTNPYQIPDLKGDTVEIPASDILKASKKIFEQTGPKYSVFGKLTCSVITEMLPPYESNSSCAIQLGSRTQELEASDLLVDSLINNVKPMTGPTYFFKGYFMAFLSHDEFPPYEIHEGARVVLTIELPAGRILEAAREIREQTGPTYEASGELRCSVISMEFPPYQTTSDCGIDIEGKKVSISEHESILDVVMALEPMTGPMYFFESKFTISSIVDIYPPYESSDLAEIIVFE